jgi:hypothetical protein
MSVDAAPLFLSLVVGGVGFVFLVYGKRQQRWPQAVGGLLLMVYPYFVSSTWAMAVVGVAIVAAVWLAIRLGW